MNKIYSLLLTAALSVVVACSTTPPPQACGPVPTDAQLEWQQMETYAFVHFGLNTFTDMEWGSGGEDLALFNPSSLDCRQWAAVCKEAGLKGIILTAKHHDGFCLWPSAYTEYSVKNTPWRGGQGDLLRELSDACREYGLKFGVYLSPWDRNRADYGTPDYITYYRDQLKEVLSNYGDVFEVWFDGANGGQGYYGGANENRNVDRKTYYDWPTTQKLVRSLQPQAMIFSDAGPDIRWCGNERGWVGTTNWSSFRCDEAWPGWPRSRENRTGHEDGKFWAPAEVDVSIRPGWFFHEAENERVKTPQQLLDIYYTSVGRNGNLLLNLPVDKDGLVHPTDVQHLKAFGEAVRADFAQNLAESAKATATAVRGNSRTYAAAQVTDQDDQTYWATDDAVTDATVTITLGKEPVAFNCLLIQEYIALGQRVKSFEVEALVAGQWQSVAKGTTIGYKRILRFDKVQATQVRVHIADAKACPLISRIAVYDAPSTLSPNAPDENLGQRPGGQRPDGPRPDGQRPAGQRPDGQRPAAAPRS